MALGDAADHGVQSAGAWPAAAVALGAAGSQHLLELVVAHHDSACCGELAGDIERVEQAPLCVLAAELRAAESGW